MSAVNAFAGVFLIAAPPFRKSPTKEGPQSRKEKEEKGRVLVGRGGCVGLPHVGNNDEIMRRRVSVYRFR